MINPIKNIKDIKDERGVALITALLFLVLLTVMGLAAVMTSSTDIFISRNDYAAKKAIYVADAGAQEAMAQLNSMTPAPDPPSTNPNWTSSPIQVKLSTGTAVATISYKKETKNNDDVHKFDNSTGVVMYNRAYQYSSSPYRKSDEGFPVFTIKSVSTSSGGGSATVIVDVAKQEFRTIPPGALYSGGHFSMAGNSELEEEAEGSNIGNLKPIYVSPAGTVSRTGNSTSLDYPTGYGPNTGTGSFNNMTGGVTQAYIGKLSALQQLAAEKGYSYTYNYNPSTGKGAWATPPGEPMGPWGSRAGNTPAVVYIDTGGTTFSMTAANKAAGSYCIFVVKGSIDISGTTGMDGLLYVTGNLTMNGTGNDNEWHGGIMVGGTTSISGNTEVDYSYGALAGLQNYFRYRVLSWGRVYQ